MSAWYAIRTVPIHRIEFSVGYELNQMAPERAMVPSEIKWEKRRGSRALRPARYTIFPCYVFASFADVREFAVAKAYINQLAEAKGKKAPIVALVGYGSRPAVLSATDVSLLQTLSAPEPTTVAIHKALQAGGQATIIAPGHPFQGQTVEIDSITRKKVKVFLNFLNSRQSVEIDAGSLVAA